MMEKLPGGKSEVVREIEDKVVRQERMLAKEVEKFCAERGEEVMGIAREKVMLAGVEEDMKVRGRGRVGAAA